jgi:hypothetical protein
MTVRSILILLARKITKVGFRPMLSQRNVAEIDLWFDFGSLRLVHGELDLNAKGRLLQCESGVMKLKGETDRRTTKTLYEGKGAQGPKLVSGVGTRRIMAPTTNQADVYPFMGLTLL